MAATTTSYAVLAKARAKYGKFLTDHDYDGILSCQSVPEVMVYLKSHTHYAAALEDISERDVHRGRLEELLRQDQFREFDSLCRYDSAVSAGFSRYIVARAEVEQIVHFLILLNSDSADKFIFQFPAFLSKHTEIDFNKMANARSYSELIEVLNHTPYDDILKMFAPVENGKIPVSDIENKLYAHIVKFVLNYIDKQTKGSERQELTDIFTKTNDYGTISRIIRLKQYYQMPPESIRTKVDTEHSGLGKKTIDRMCDAATADDVFRIVEGTRYGRLLRKDGSEYDGDIGSRGQYKLSKKYLKLSNNPSVVMISFMFLSEAELKNVICMIEGIRYQVDPKVIRSMLMR